VQKAETASKEKSKASTVAINAEIRRTKARLLEEVPKLQNLAMKKDGSSLSLLLGIICTVLFVLFYLTSAFFLCGILLTFWTSLYAFFTI